MMNPGPIHWILIAVLLLVPLLVTGCLNWYYRKRGGIGKGWGGALLVILCWITALVLIWMQVSD